MAFDCEFQCAGNNHGDNINRAVQVQQIQFAQPNGLVDDPFLHFQGDDPGSHRDRNDQNGRDLESAIARPDPGKNGSLENRRLFFAHSRTGS